MKIDSGLSGYPYPTRSQTIERGSEETAPREVEQRQRSAFAITGSSTLLSTSLANALWVIGGSEDDAAKDGGQSPVSAASTDMPADWVEGMYLEFSENS